MYVCMCMQLKRKVEGAVSSLHVVLDHTHDPLLLSLPQLVNVIIDGLRSPLLEDILQEVWVKVTVATLRKGAEETGTVASSLHVPLAPPTAVSQASLLRAFARMADSAASVSEGTQETEMGGESCDGSIGGAAGPPGAGSSHAPLLVLPRPPGSEARSPAWQGMLEDGRRHHQISVSCSRRKPVSETVHCC